MHTEARKVLQGYVQGIRIDFTRKSSKECTFNTNFIYSIVQVKEGKYQQVGFLAIATLTEDNVY